MDNITALYILLSFLFITNVGMFGFLLAKMRALSRISKSLDINSLKQLSRDTEKLKKEISKSFQKVGVVKFNPFKSMGGKLSFSIALLNARNNGIVVSGLHNRESTRIYVKDFSYGENGKIELSLEEKKAVEKAVRS